MAVAGRDVASNTALVGIKILHTVVWAVMAGAIVALPFLALNGQLRWVLIATALIVAECAVLAVNRGRCPLTDWAAGYTADRADNFDIYLPNWLARHNKMIFGALFVLNEVISVWLLVQRG